MGESVSARIKIPEDPYSIEDIYAIIEHYRASDVLSSSELRQIFNDYPNLRMYRGGEAQDDLGENYSFSQDIALTWTSDDHDKKKREKPAVIMVTADDLDTAIQQYAVKKTRGNIDLAYRQIVGGGQSDLMVNIGMDQLNYAQCMPKRTYFTPLTQSFLSRIFPFLSSR